MAPAESVNQVNSEQLAIYVCPSCRGPLRSERESLRCPTCPATYLVVAGIPDFVGPSLASKVNPMLRAFLNLPLLGQLYESRLWYPVILRVFGGSEAPSFEGLMEKIAALVAIETGSVVDVACGPGTLGRRIASPTRTVYGVDISWSMLRQGVNYTSKDAVHSMQFARASADLLPFPDDRFDVALFGGALHLFPDTVAVLREVCRVMKQGATLIVTTFTPSSGSILRFRRLSEWYDRHGGLRVFELPQIAEYLNQAGFEDFAPQVYGSLLTFSARKRALQTTLGK